MTKNRRPVYFRLLGIRHLRPRPLSTFLLFEGSIALGLLMALAEIVNVWGVLAIPAAVALMVKMHDVVAGALLRPAAAAQLRVPRFRDRRSIGVSKAPVASMFAVDLGSVIRRRSAGAVGVAPVTAQGRAAVGPGGTAAARGAASRVGDPASGTSPAASGFAGGDPPAAPRAPGSRRSGPAPATENHDERRDVDDWRLRGNQGHFS